MIIGNRRIYESSILKMSELRRNITANFFGTGFKAGLQFVTVPIYLRLLGAEQWGLLAACITLYTMFNLLDAGISQVLPREVSLRLATKEGKEVIGDVLVSFEYIYWSIGILGSILIYFSANFMAARWLNLGSFSIVKAENVFKLVAIQFLFQFPNNCYTGVLTGTQQQIILNRLKIVFTLLRHVATIFVLYVVSPTVWVYQIIFIICTFAETSINASFAWRSINKSRKFSNWNVSEMQKMYNFMFGMTGTVIAGMVISQMDKWFLSTLLPLKEFGYYVIVSQLSCSLTLLVSPIMQALYPKISELIELKQSVAAINGKLLALISITILPFAFVLLLFPQKVLFLWTQNYELAVSTAPVLTLLLLGTVMNSFYNIPYTNLLASGNSRLPLIINLSSLAIMGISFSYSVKKFGLIGATFPSLIVNFLGMTIGFYIMIREKKISFSS